MSIDLQRPTKVLVAPLVPVALAVAAGIVADRYGAPCGTLAWGLLALTSGIIAFGVRRWEGLSSLGLLVALGAVGGGWHHRAWSDLSPNDLAWSVSEAPRPAWVKGVLLEVVGSRPARAKGDVEATRALLEVTGIRDGGRWQRASGKAQVIILGGEPDLEAGEPVEAAGSLAAVAGPLNPGEFDYRGFLQAQGIRLRLMVDDPEGVWRDPRGTASPWLRLRGAARARSYARLVAGLDPNVAPLAAALLLGRREGVDPDVNDAFARTGTTHLLAISGLHLQVLAGVLWFVFLALGLGRRGAFAAVALTTIAYATLVGWMPSVTRSVAMTVTVCLAGIFDRHSRPANKLALAAIVTLAFNPADLFDVGCQLSFLAIGAIVWGDKLASEYLQFGYYALTFRFQGPSSALDSLERALEPWWLRRVRQWPLFVTSGLVVSTVVWLAALPLVALRFHIISPIGILLNIPLIPLTSIALMAAGLALGLSLLAPWLGAPFAWICAITLRGTELIVRWGATRSWGHAFVAGPHWAWALVAYGLLGVATVLEVGRRPQRRWAWRAVAAWAVVGIIAAWLPRRLDALEADVLAVGHGLAVVIQSPDGRAIVYDCGRMRDPSVGRRIVAPALWERGVSRLEAVILSHADSDHYNGLPDLLDRFAIKAVRIPPGFESAANPGAVELLKRVRSRGVAVLPIAEGDRWESAGARFAVWHPTREQDRGASDNARSVVVDVESRSRHLLLTGDLEQEGLERLLTRPPSPLDSLLSPHHGGRTANPEALYAWADPAHVIVSQRPPSAGARDAIAPIEARGVPVFRTWQRGAVRLRWAADRLAVRGFLDREEGPSSAGTAAMAQPSLPFATVGPAWRDGLVASFAFVLGLVGCLLLTVIDWGAWALVLPGRRLGSIVAQPEPGEPIAAMAADGTPLAGIWIPSEASRGRTVLLVHGFAEYRRAFHERVEFLTRRGWNVARIDLRGYGRSGGDRTSFGGREADDLRAWIDVLASRVGPTLRLAVWGRSMGAAIAERAAAEDSRIAALVLESPYADLETIVAGWLRRYRLPAPRVLARLILARAARLAGVSLARPRPIDLAPRVSAAAILVHGTDDALVPAGDARRLAEAFPHAASLVEVNGAGHGNVFEIGGADLLERIAEFLERTVREREPLSET